MCLSVLEKKLHLFWYNSLGCPLIFVKVTFVSSTGIWTLESILYVSQKWTILRLLTDDFIWCISQY